MNKLKLLLHPALLAGLLLAVQLKVSAADALEELVQKTRGISSYQARFNQKIKDQFDNLKDQSEGDFILQKPFKFIWHTQSPYEQKIVSDGENLWTFDIDLDQVNIQTLNKALGNTPVFLLEADAATLANTFVVNKLQSGDDVAQTFELKPKQAGYAFERMLVLFKADRLQEILLYDTLGQKTIVDFSDIKVNQPLDPDVFNFKIPQGVDVVDSRVDGSDTSIEQ
jgi:outer membrane lipoprotein carrier protein